MSRICVLAAFTLAAGLLLAGSNSTAQPPPKAGELKLLPLPGPPVAAGQPAPGQAVIAGQPAPGQPVIVGGAELPVVPKSAPMFVSVKVSALVDHPDLKPVLEQLQKTPEGTEGFVEMLGVAPHEIDRVTLFWPTASDLRGFGDPVLVVTTRQPYNEARLLKSLRAEPVFERDWQHDRWGGHGGAIKDGPATKVAIPKEADFPKPPPPLTAPRLDSAPPKPAPPPRTDPKPPLEDCAFVPISARLVDEPLFYEIRRGPLGLVFLIDERTIVYLPRDFAQGISHLALLAQLMRKQAGGPLSEAIAAAGGHTIAAGAHLTPLVRAMNHITLPELAPYSALLAARTAVITGNLDKSARLTLTLTFEDAAAARRAAPVLEEGLRTLAGKAADLAAEKKDSPRPEEKAIAALVETVAKGLRTASAKASGNAVVATADIEVGPAAGKAAAEMIQALATQKKLVERTNNLKMIGLALHNYHDTHGRLPTNVYNAKGEAILSWRVHLLPFLEYDNLYKQMKLDEPWDGPTNKQFIEQLPKVYEVPGREAPKGKTYFQTFVSPDPRKPLAKGGVFMPGRAWLMEGEKMGRSIAAIPDGTSNTIAVVEARDAVIWSKPDDLPFGEKLPALGEERNDRFGVLFFDGSVRLLPTRIDHATLRALITLDGGEVIAEDLDRPRRGVGPGGAIPREAPDRAPATTIPPKGPIK
jgi:hypothetical protein